MEQKIRATKQAALDELNKVSSELETKIDELDKKTDDNHLDMKNKHHETQMKIKNEIKQVRDEGENNINNQVTQLKQFVQQATEKVNTNNDGIYEKYDEKLKKIKDVCA